jgi:hypothetical protein
MSSISPVHIQAFLTKWQASGGAERANAQTFLNELCDILEVERPQPKTNDEHANAYVFEKTIPSVTDTSNFIDLYKRGCFVLETKQGTDAVGADDHPPLSAEGLARRKNLKTGHGVRDTKAWGVAMMKAREQAQRYARALPKEEIAEGRPPFVLVVDVGHSIALYTDWTRMGAEYVAFPDPTTFRIPLKDLLKTEVRALLRAVWMEPLTLDPGRRSAKVTREIADSLAKLAKSLEGRHPPEQVANFLMRCLFTMFSEDVDLLPHGSFTALLGNLKKDPESFVPAMESLWQSMNTGGYAAILQKKLPRFNGGLFAHADAIALDADQIQLLIEASTANWKDVEPAIFGTLLERALDPRERHKLGAHYTPRAYVERLVNPTVIEPLREQWKSVQVAALQLAGDSTAKKGVDKAVKEVEAFLYQLANIRVLDPACGSGNFLYVTLELLKRLEGEVLNMLQELSGKVTLEYNTHTLSPANFFGIELNPRAAAIAEQVLWIGFLQWQLRTHGNLHTLPEPIIKDLHNIENRDAVLDYESKTELRDADGQVVSRWDGHTTKLHPITGEAVPDPDARVPLYTYSKPKPAQWPAADYIVGNPPFIGDKRMKDALGEGYADALRIAYEGLVPGSCDFVMYWWFKAAVAVSKGSVRRFGLISTNSITQKFNRRVIEDMLTAMKAVSLAYAVPDHPWVDSADGAAVRISMTVGVSGKKEGILATVTSEVDGADEVTVSLVNQAGKIHADLTVGANTTATIPLLANEGLACNGVQLSGMGFAIERRQAEVLGLGTIEGTEKVIRRYRNGKDLMATVRDVLVVDFFGLTEAEARRLYPAAYQHVLQTVKPERDQNNRETYRRNWWVFAEPRAKYRPALNGVHRYVATCRTAKHRVFSFLEADIVPDAKVVAIALNDAYFLGVLSSTIHTHWAQTTGGWLGVGNDSNYNHSECFMKFPFPACTPAQQEKIRALGEQLDAHRKRQQALHPELTMTGMYNVLERVRALRDITDIFAGKSPRAGFTERGPAGDATLNTKERRIYDQGLVGILLQLHDELDTAVAEAYSWPINLGADEFLTRLVALNAERAAEEAKGLVRWLRPEYQNAGAGASGKQTEMEVEDDGLALAPAPALSPKEWPSELPAQVSALSEVLGALSAPASVEAIAAHFEGKPSKKRLEEMVRLLETLRALGLAGVGEGGWMAQA